MYPEFQESPYNTSSSILLLIFLWIGEKNLAEQKADEPFHYMVLTDEAIAPSTAKKHRRFPRRICARWRETFIIIPPVKSEKHRCSAASAQAQTQKESDLCGVQS